jgi:tetratricopeptide (TPR) repeat protein
MSKENNNKPVTEEVPNWVKKAPELLPVWDWWVKDGRSTVTWLLVAGVFVAGFYAWKNWQTGRTAAANAALVNAFTADELEEAVAKFGGTETGPALKLRLAKNYFDAARYNEALAQYEELDGKAPDGFEDVPKVGKAQCLEALGRFAEAQKAFDEFAAANPKSFLKLTAQLGAARCVAAGGDKKKALERLEALKAECDKDELAQERIAATVTLVKRYEAKK